MKMRKMKTVRIAASYLGTDANYGAAENHYTADYPEEEAESDDELHAYWNRNRNASDEEEFDQDDYDDDDEIAMEGDDDDTRMARIVDRIRREHIASERYP